MRLVIIVWVGLLIAGASYGQKLTYNCRSTGNLSVKLKVTPLLRPLDKKKEKIKITKYEINSGTQVGASFFLYKHDSRLHIMDGSSAKLNPSIDPVLFSLPHQSSYRLNLSGIFENSATVLISAATINGDNFYKYDVMSPKKNLNITEFIFDKNMIINEMKIATDNITCSCTKSNVIIKLR